MYGSDEIHRGRDGIFLDNPHRADFFFRRAVQVDVEEEQHARKEDEHLGDAFESQRVRRAGRSVVEQVAEDQEKGSDADGLDKVEVHQNRAAGYP